jgi:prefoldin alpha subunit
MVESRHSSPQPQAPIATTLEELRYLQQIYQNQYGLVSQEINNRSENLRELDSAQQTLENIDIIKDKSTLVSTGASTFAFGKITDNKSVVIGIGAGYMVEKSIDEAKNYISKAIEQESKYITQLNKSKKEVEAALIEIEVKVDELSH